MKIQVSCKPIYAYATGIGQEGIQALAEILMKDRVITELNLAYCSIDLNGLLLLLASLKNTNKSLR